MHSLYRWYDADNALLYIGIARNPMNRLGQHGGAKDISQIAKIELTWFDARKDAKAAEAIAISKEQPLWNLNHTGKDQSAPDPIEFHKPQWDMKKW